MISLHDAYRIIKDDGKILPLLSLYEYSDSYMAFSITDENRIAVVDKNSGKLRYESMPGTSEWIFGKQKEVYLKELFDEMFICCSNHRNEALIARFYQIAYNECFYDENNKRSLSMYKSKDDYDMIISRWREIEAHLYTEIIAIMSDDKTIVYPPCVLAKWEDPFYRIKPFMLRNGYTDAGSSKTWVKCKNKL